MVEQTSSTRRYVRNPGKKNSTWRMWTSTLVCSMWLGKKSKQFSSDAKPISPVHTVARTVRYRGSSIASPLPCPVHKTGIPHRDSFASAGPDPCKDTCWCVLLAFWCFFGYVADLQVGQQVETYQEGVQRRLAF